MAFSNKGAGRPAQRNARTPRLPVECGDQACTELVDQALTGRPRVYCDATCRANEHRRRLWEAHDEAMSAWRAADRVAQEEFRERMEAWHASAWEPEPVWADEARSLGWHGPARKHTSAAPTYVRQPAPREPSVSRPRIGRKGRTYSQGRVWL